MDLRSEVISVVKSSSKKENRRSKGKLPRVSPGRDGGSRWHEELRVVADGGRGVGAAGTRAAAAGGTPEAIYLKELPHLRAVGAGRRNK